MLHMDIVCIGDSGIDVYLNYPESTRERLGGCSLNVAMNIEMPPETNANVSLITALSENNFWSKSIADVVVSKGVALCASVLPGELAVQKICLKADGERIFQGYNPGVLSTWRPNRYQSEIVINADVVVTLVFEQIIPLFTSIIELPRRGKIAVDFMDMGDFRKDFELIEGYLHQCDIAFFGLSKLADKILIDQIKKWFGAQNGNKIAVMTFGSEGSTAVGKGFSIDQQALPVQRVVDTTGAGDSFAAGFLSAFLSGKEVSKSLEVASERAARVVQQRGAF